MLRPLDAEGGRAKLEGTAGRPEPLWASKTLPCTGSDNTSGRCQMDVDKMSVKYHEQPPRQPAPPAASPAVILMKALSDLVGLGGPDEIAKCLQERGVRGAREDGSKCVLVNYFRSVTGCSKLHVEILYTSYPGGQIDNPPEIRAFLQRFDRGVFPELLEPVPRCPATPAAVGPPGAATRELVPA